MSSDVNAEGIDALVELIRSLDTESNSTVLEQVQTLRMVREAAESALKQAVPAAAAEGATWAQIGRALDVTTQAAHQRYGIPAATTYACGHCTEERTLEGAGVHEQLNAWAEEHVAEAHAAEDRWPITFRVIYARNPGLTDVHYVRSPAYRG